MTTRDNHSQPVFNSYRQNSYNKSTRRYQRYPNEKINQAPARNYSMNAKPRPALADGLGQPIPDRRDNTFNALPPVTHQGPPPGFGVYGPQPMYTLTPHLPHILPTAAYGGFRVPYVPFPPYFTRQFSSLHPRSEHVNMSDREQASTCHIPEQSPPNTQLGELNGARVQTSNSSSRPTAQQTQETDANKHLRQNSCSSDNRTIWIGCLSPAIIQYDFDRVLSLFARSGNIEYWRTLIPKFCAFIT
jgi:hypothetical protein